MGRQRNPNRDRAKEIFREHDGKITNREIARQLGEDERTVAVWKGRDNWDISNVVQQKRKPNVVQHKKTNKKLLEAVEENDELSEREKLFCFYYVKTYNGAGAVRKAGYAEGCANRYAYQLKQKPKIREEIKRLKEIRNRELWATGDDVVERMMAIAFADITDFVDFGREEVPVMAMYGPVEVKNEETGEKETLTKEINVVRFKESDDIDGTILSEVKQGRDGASVKLADKMAALKWLGDYFELNPMDRHKREYDNRRLELEAERVSAIKDGKTGNAVNVVITGADSIED